MLEWMTGQVDVTRKGHVCRVVTFCFQVKFSRLYTFLPVTNGRALHAEQAPPREWDLALLFKEMKGISGAHSACSQHTFPEQVVGAILKP